MVAGYLAARAVTPRGHERSRNQPGPGLEDFASGFGADLAAALAQAPAGADPQAAYGKAFATVTEYLLDCSCAVAFDRFIGNLPDRSGVTEAIVWGEIAGQAVMRSRSGDDSEPGLSGYNLGRYPRPHHPLKWQAAWREESRVPELASRTNVGGIFPGFGKIALWTSCRQTPLRADFFHNPAGPDFAEDFDLLRSVGGAQSMVRTPDQTQSALFWSGIPGGVTIAGHFLLIAILALRDRGLDFLGLARVFALIGMVQSDVTVQAWDSKYHFDIMRPETAIRCRGGALGNSDPRVTLDKDWCSAIPTPEYPAYTSSHSAIAAAGTEILRHLLQSDRIQIAQTAPDAELWLDGAAPQRQWASLSEILEDCGMSRIFGGVNWLLDHEKAVEFACITARNALSRFLPDEL
ncbi:vanadium-dependent haloperoxidase [Parasphingorhabdus marina]|nr:vanadium-dependent haloperoxidase [Parasphingorhabdus marina]